MITFVPLGEGLGIACERTGMAGRRVNSSDGTDHSDSFDLNRILFLAYGGWSSGKQVGCVARVILFKV